MVNDGTLVVIGSIFVIVAGGYLVFALSLASVGTALDQQTASGLTLVLLSAGLLTLGGVGWYHLTDD